MWPEFRELTAALVGQAKQRQDQVLDESIRAISLQPLLFRTLSSQDSHPPSFQVTTHSVNLESHLLLFSLLSSTLEKVTFQQSLCEHSAPVFPGGSSFQGAWQAVGPGHCVSITPTSPPTAGGLVHSSEGANAPLI